VSSSSQTASRTACQYSGGISSAGPTGRVAQADLLKQFAASFSICSGVGMRQLAGRSVMVDSNISRTIESLKSRKSKKSSPDQALRVGTKAPHSS
jgi:hypothetical protein